MNKSKFSHIRTTRGVVAALTLALLAASATAADVPAAVRSELAPTGKLRVALLVNVPAMVKKDGTPEEMQGLGVDMARELARQVGVAFEPVRYPNVAALLEDGKAGKWDVAPIPATPQRAAFLDFTAPYTLGTARYIVLADSPIKAVSDVDRPGHRIVTAPQSVTEPYLASNLRHAQLVSATGGLGLLESGKVDAWLAVASVARDRTTKNPKLRLVEGVVRFGGPALAIPKGRPTGAAYVKEYVEHAKASGFVQQAIERNGLTGRVAPPASAH